MKPLHLVFILLTGLFLSVMSPFLWAAGNEFSADMVSTSSQGTFTSKMYTKGSKTRMETSAQGHTSITIMRMDKKVMWMLMPEEKMYLENPIKNPEVSSRIQDPETKMEKKFIGNETVDGHPCKKYHVTVFGKDGKKAASGYMWEATDLKNFPIKWQDEDKSATVVWKNIKFGGVADKLFEIPAGYEKMEMPGGMGIPGM